jgi:hypothetical protein
MPASEASQPSPAGLNGTCITDHEKPVVQRANNASRTHWEAKGPLSMQDEQPCRPAMQDMRSQKPAACSLMEVNASHSRHTPHNRTNGPFYASTLAR